jgi:hypothetical protein
MTIGMISAASAPPAVIVAANAVSRRRFMELPLRLSRGHATLSS